MVALVCIGREVSVALSHAGREMAEDPLQAEQISAWFAGKLPFRLELPNYQDGLGKEKRYDIQGVRLVGYKPVLRPMYSIEWVRSISACW